ncbi:replication initiation protein [Brucella sp. BE17]|uniref:replication initiation protein n=1 Tax=Brucella sp. BE17 TaxID=3142977 RepID=UPI0031BAFDD2
MPELIQPATRGTIVNAIASSSLTKVAPESPRPLEMLEAVEITSADILTAADAALHELLISAAYESDKGMPNELTALPVATALKFLGQHARRDALKVSMRRLMNTTVSYGTAKTRRFEDVPLVFSYLETTEEADVIRYSLPEPIRILMREMPAYAYLELAPISQMKSKYSVRLYRVFAAAAAREKWIPGGENKVIVSATLEDLYQWTGFPLENGTMTFGKFRQRVLKDLTSELSTVRRFSVRIDEVRKEARGRPLERVDFHLNLRAPSHHLTRAPFEPGEHNNRGVGGVDAPDYRVNSNIWVKAQNSFWSIQKRSHDLYFAAWQIAIQEALAEEPVSPGYTTRQYRGHRLLLAIETLGADEAAFKFCAEEVDKPDLLEAGAPDLTVDSTEAQEARKARVGIEAPNFGASNHAYTKQSASKVEKDDNSPKKGIAFTKPIFSTPTQSGFRRPPEPQVSNFIEEAGEVAMSDIAADMLAELISDEPVTFDPQEVPKGTNVTLADASEVIWTADRGMSMDEIEAEIWPAFQDENEGPRTVKLTVRAWVDGCAREFSFGQSSVDQSAIDQITRAIGHIHLDPDFDAPEYVR